MALARADRKIILVTSGLLVLAAAFFAAVVLFATSGGRSTPDDDGPLFLGPKRQIVQTLNEGEGSPLYFANPFGGRGFWVDREDGELVALDVGLPSDPDCSIKWKGRINTYTDCHGRPVTMDEMARHPVSISSTGNTRGGVYVSLDVLEPPPSQSG